MRRLILVEPVSKAAAWSRRMAIFGLLLAAIAVAASRAGATEPLGALAVLAAALVFGLMALLAALLAAVVIWRTGRPGIGPALGGTALALLLLAYPAWLAVRGAHVPDLSDVSTDSVQPLLFSALPKAVAARHGAVHAVPADRVYRLQAGAYPDVRPLMLDVTAADAFKAAQKLVSSRRWTVIEAQAPTAGRPVGHIDAVAKSTVMGFPGDITIRVTAVSATQSRVDFRSASRTAWTDLGSNAARITAFSTDLEAAAGEE
jgi:uncharacterized protein (DUF1499 family)